MLTKSLDLNCYNLQGLPCEFCLPCAPSCPLGTSLHGRGLKEHHLITQLIFLGFFSLSGKLFSLNFYSPVMFSSLFFPSPLFHPHLHFFCYYPSFPCLWIQIMPKEMEDHGSSWPIPVTGEYLEYAMLTQTMPGSATSLASKQIFIKNLWISGHFTQMMQQRSKQTGNHCSQVGKTHTQAPGRFPKATEKQTRELSSVIRVDWVVMKDVSK